MNSKITPTSPPKNLKIPSTKNCDLTSRRNTQQIHLSFLEYSIGGHSSFNDFTLKEDLLRSVKEAGFERPSEGKKRNALIS